MSRWTVLAVLLIALTGGAYLATLRAGHGWGDDFALYLAHARNLAEGAPYAQTGYLYNPSFPSLSPRTYPPIYPLLAAPVYQAFGLNFEALKAEIVVFFLLFLLVTYFAARRELPGPCALAVVLALAACPFFWDYKDRLLSEVPFLLFAGLALWLADLAQEGGLRRRALLAVLTGAAVYLAIGTRSVGVVLVPSLVLAELARRRRPGPLTLLAVPTIGLGLFLQRTFLALEGSYLDQLVWAPGQFARTAVSLVKAMGLFLENGHSRGLRLALYGPVLALAAVGYLARLRREASAREWFVPLYFAIIVVWPCAEWSQRFLLPLLAPFWVYLWHGLLEVRAYLERRAARREPAGGAVDRPAVNDGPARGKPGEPGWEGATAPAGFTRLEGCRPVPSGRAAQAPYRRAHAAPLAGAALLALVLASYAGQYARVDLGPLPQGVHRAESQALLEHVRARTPQDAVFLFQYPRALALYTGRKALAHHPRASDADLWRDLTKHRVTHVIVARPQPQSYALLSAFVARNPGRFATAYRNPHFTVYRIRPAAADEERPFARAGIAVASHREVSR
jgi:hypothetical protein